MSFDMSTAQPVQTSGFDISTAVPIENQQFNDSGGFLSNFGNDISKRVQTGQDIEKAYNSGQIELPEAVMQHVGNIGFGTMGDVVGEGVKSLASTLTPDFIQQHIQDKLHQLLSTDTGKMAIQAVQSGGDTWNKFAAENPNAARDITALGNAASFLNTVSKAGAEITGAAAGAAKDTAGAAAGKLVGAALPNVNEGIADTAQLALKHNIPLSVDQITDSNALKNIQKVSQELPFSGQESFRQLQLAQFNKALLGTIGQDGTKVTQPIMKKAFATVGGEFDKLGAGKTFTLDDNFSRNLDQIRQEAEMTSSSDSINNFTKAATMVLKEAGPTGEITGEKLNAMRAKINGLARGSNSRDTGDLLHKLEVSLIDTMSGGDEATQKAFNDTKQKYKNLLAIEPLAAKAKGGNINPTLLNDRVYKIYGRQHVIGQSGDIGDLAKIGHELLPQLGGSDTLQKAMYAKGAGLLGTAAAEPFVGAPTIAAGLTANRLAQSGINRNQAIVKQMLKKGVKNAPK